MPDRHGEGKKAGIPRGFLDCRGGAFCGYFAQKFWGGAESCQNPPNHPKQGTCGRLEFPGWGKTPDEPIICKKIERLREKRPLMGKRISTAWEGGIFTPPPVFEALGGAFYPDCNLAPKPTSGCMMRAYWTRAMKKAHGHDVRGGGVSRGFSSADGLVFVHNICGREI